MSELLPCPFCGSANVAQGASRDSISVWCFCGAQGPVVPFPEINPEPIVAIHKCFELWNRRANASSKAELERLTKALIEARRYVAYLAGDDRTFVGSGMPSECLSLIDAALSGSKD